MRRIFSKMLTVFVCAIVAFSAGVFSACDDGKGDVPPPAGGDTYANVSSVAIVDGKQKSIPAGMFEQDGNYPETYLYDRVTTVDDLKQTYSTRDYDATFLGWFWDEECTQEFENIPATQRGDVVLYASIEMDGAWTGWNPL